MNPFAKMNAWLAQERELGSINPDRGILATTSKNAIPHNRVVAIREINDQGILFFTQAGTKKVLELRENPIASMVIWLAQQQRQIIINGTIKELSLKENESYWRALSKDRQLRFAAYAPTSSQPIQTISELNEYHQQLTHKYTHAEVPLCKFYIGFRLIAEEIYFYTLGTESFSEVTKLTKQNDIWNEILLSP